MPAGVVSAVQELHEAACTSNALFDFTEMINLAVQFLEGDARRGRRRAGIVQEHIRDDIRYVVVDEYQDVNPLQERLVAGPDAVRREPVRRRRRRPDDLPVARQPGLQHRHLRGPLRRRPAGHPRRQLPIERGLVEVGRSVAERIPAANGCRRRWSRRPPDVASAATCSRASSATSAKRRPGSATASRRCAGWRSGTRPRSEPRGLSWSDFAVLFRSVAKDSGPLVAELRRRDIPFVVKGLNRLFDSPEIQAVVGVFRFMAGLDCGSRPASAVGRRESCSRPMPTGLRRMAVLDEGRDFDRGERWGVYNIQRLYLDFLEALDLREETLPGEPVRRELVFYQLGKFSQAISDFEQIYFNTDAAGRSTRRSPSGSSTRRPATTRTPTPTSATRRPTP